jgi:hypothetical protein
MGSAHTELAQHPERVELLPLVDDPSIRQMVDVTATAVTLLLVGGMPKSGPC